MNRKENPAKLFLRRYIAISGRVDALNRAIQQAMERAFNTSISLKEIKVLSSPAEHDPMAEDVCSVVDACEILYQRKAEAEVAYKAAVKAVDQGVNKGIVNKNAAARKKSSLTLKLNKLA